jgi:hypothetical protein
MGRPAEVSALDLAVTHLNAPVGRVLTPADLSEALKSGSVASIHRADAAALITYMFVELDPSLIIRCVNELRSGLIAANGLYEETLKANAPRSPAWEKSVRHLL